MTDLAARKLLVPFLFTIKDEKGRAEWFGVSGYSREDAIALLSEAGFQIDPNAKNVTVRENVRLTDFEERHIGQNMGPMQFRGVWYPRLNVK
jgi:hypothetical protein